MTESLNASNRIVVFTFNLNCFGAAKPRNLFYFMFESTPLEVMSKPIGISIQVKEGIFMDLKAVDERPEIKNPKVAIRSYGMIPMPNLIRTALGYRI